MPPIYRSRERVFRDRPDLGPGVRELVYGLGSPIPLEEAIRQGIVAPSRAEVLDTATQYRAPAPPAAAVQAEEAVLEVAAPSTFAVGAPDPAPAPPELAPAPEPLKAADPQQAVTTGEFPQERTYQGAKRLPRRVR